MSKTYQKYDVLSMMSDLGNFRRKMIILGVAAFTLCLVYPVPSALAMYDIEGPMEPTTERRDFASRKAHLYSFVALRYNLDEFKVAINKWGWHR